MPVALRDSRSLAAQHCIVDTSHHNHEARIILAEDSTILDPSFDGLLHLLHFCVQHELVTSCAFRASSQTALATFCGLELRLDVLGNFLAFSMVVSSLDHLRSGFNLMQPSTPTPVL